MRKFKLFLLLAVAAGSLFSLTACSDDDDDSAAQSSSDANIAALVGTWTGSYGDETFTFTFGADGRFTETCTHQGQSETDCGTYTYDGSVLTLRYDDGDVDSYPVVITDDTLSMDDLVYTKTGNGDGGNGGDKEDGDSSYLLVGTWEYKDASVCDRYTFTDEGSFTNITEEYGRGTYEESGTYTYDGRYLHLRDPEGFLDIYEVTVSGDEMTWHDKEGDMVYIRQ